MVRVSFSAPVAVSGAPRIRMGLDGDDGRFAIANSGFLATDRGDLDGDKVRQPWKACAFFNTSIP